MNDTIPLFSTSDRNDRRVRDKAELSWQYHRYTVLWYPKHRSRGPVIKTLEVVIG